MKLLKIVFKVNLFISSYIPLYILIFIQSMENFQLKSVLQTYKENNILWNVIISISIFSIVSLIVFFCGNYTKKETFKEVRSIDNDILNYFITYIIPLTTVDITKSTSIAVNFIIFSIIGIYYIQSNLMYLNILLIFMNYRVFQDNNNNIIITKENADYFKMNEKILCKKIGNTKIYIVK